MKKSLRASALFLLAAAFVRPVAAQTQLPPVTMPEAGMSDDTTRVRLELQPDSLVAEPVQLDSVRLAWLQAPPEARDLICDRVACFDSDVPHAFNSTVLAHINFFTLRNRNYMQRVLERENLYFPLFEKYLTKYNLPPDLKYLAVVESALIPTAKSRVGATGLWQFMGPTANDLRLRRDEWVDERMDPEKATEAACKHLRYLYGVFHDWELVLAAYNWGAGNIQRVMRKSGKRNFWEMYPYMPKETRNYVPSFTAIMYAMKYAEQHNLHSAELKYQYAQPMDTLQLNGQAFDMMRLSQAVGLDSTAILRFNPELRRPYLPDGYRAYTLQFPADRRALLQSVDRSVLFGYCRPQAALPTPMEPLPPRLEGVEPFPSARQLAASSRRKPAAATADAPTDEPPRTQRKLHNVKRGQTLAELAEWYGVSQTQLRRWNNLPKGRALKPKQQIVVFLPAKNGSVNSASTQNVAVRPTAAPAVAAAPRTPTEMGVKVSKLAVKPTAKPETPEPEETAVAAAPVAAPVERPAAEPRKPTRTTRPVAAAPTRESSADAESVAAPEPTAAVSAVQTQQDAATEYVIRKGDYLTKLARERGLSVEQLVAWNNLKSQVVTPGQKLRLTPPADAEATGNDESEKPAVVAATPKPSSKPGKVLALPLQQRVHVVQPGDTLYNISRRYQGLTVEQLRKLNHLQSDEVKPGQKLIVAS
ncbi:lytic transglycosylase domain-containing protein [Hymenobacter jeollabukensis]|uniref:LysM peptidoglycan-binding domain-containing protein n=1 Tax=Hymenobacter jeollabukensis TaxID=2025313 RepID=A0A5R8WSW6_9BACT|nr:lytic transglycosylase domain-containing protein [Hymenobacter jeollabukensis]TLM94281.1 LysM peptidoglycan-binding domain-containing protein [Hymenobacter jeollabukensis]